MRLLIPIQIERESNDFFDDLIYILETFATYRILNYFAIGSFYGEQSQNLLTIVYKSIGYTKFFSASMQKVKYWSIWIQASLFIPNNLRNLDYSFNSMEEVKFRSLLSDSPHKNNPINKTSQPSLASQAPSIKNSSPHPHFISNIRRQRNTDCVIRRTESRKRTLLKQARTEMMNQNLSRQTLKKLKKVNTEETQSSEIELKRIRSLKAYIRNITNTCNNIQRSKNEDMEVNNDKPKEPAQRLTINNLSFTEIQEEKIEKQKLYLNNFEHLRCRNSKMISTVNLSQEKAVGDSLVLIFRQIDRLYEILEEMQDLGYFKRHNKSIVNFCTNSKIWLSKVFLYESNSRKDAFSIKTQWLVVATSEEAKRKLSNFLSKESKIDFLTVKNDIQDLVDHLEQSLGQKKLIEISKIGDYIQTRFKDLQFQEAKGENIKMLRVARSKPEECNFSKQLSQLEERCGSMNIVTKVSRRRFQDLTRTYEKLHSFL